MPRAMQFTHTTPSGGDTSHHTHSFDSWKLRTGEGQNPHIHDPMRTAGRKSAIPGNTQLLEIHKFRGGQS